MKKLHQFHEVFDTQAVFRLLLEGMANPGRKLSVREYAEKLFGDEKSCLAVAMTLLDNEVSFCVCGDQKLARDIVLLTHARQEKREKADYIFVTDPAMLAEAVSGGKAGTLADPHQSATLVLFEAECRKTEERQLAGPGIAGVVTFAVPEMLNRAMELRDSREDEYPQGIDLIYVSGTGELLCIPRTTRREAA